ncbi:hypothetical protein [Aquimarina litoralis]|uniref:hypothetical protein n=1 Tax=Aquimarina litoralis TaxID=584605 RepID=UPI001C5828B5|nr:hypothetical protein [Aquimarina litoralis]MBW1296437.1 hypothetical protein [Aquimarina litoralis]
MNKKKKHKGLGNPAALVAANALAPSVSKATDKSIDFFGRNAKPIFLTAASLALIYFGPKWYRNWRAKKYANDNIGNPNVTAAGIIYNSFTRFEPPTYLSLILPTFDISTDEDALFKIASDPRINIKTVAEAYRILFQRNLAFDVQNGLNTDELNTFYSILQSGITNDSDTLYPIGTTLFVAKKDGVIVNKAEQDEHGNWVGTNELFAQAEFNEELGEVIANGNFEGENYYIVKDCNFLGLGCDQGVVLQNQIRNEKL